VATTRRLSGLALVGRSSRPADEGGSSPLSSVRRALTAAATRMADPVVKATAAKKPRWQERAWVYYDTLGEIHYAGEFFGANLGRVRLLAQQRVAGGDWEEVTSGEAAKQLERIRGPRGDRSEVQGAFGTTMFCVGEGYLVGTQDPEAADREVWEFLSADEFDVKVRDRKAERKRSPTDKGKVTYDLVTNLEGRIGEGEALAIRMWEPHPRWSDLPVSPLMAVLDACEELRLLPRAVRSRARSRLASAGVLVIPHEITDGGGPAPANAQGMDEDPAVDPFLSDLIDNAATAINDEDSAAAAVPIVLRVEGEHADKVQHLNFVDARVAYPETEREMHVIRRIAQGLNLPPEVLLGMADANHWSAWQISEAMWTQHLEPLCVALCANLTAAMVVPVAGTEYRVWYDDSDLVTKPDRTGDAKELHDRLAISDAALREAAGWTDEDEPEEDERNRRIGVLLKDAKLAIEGEVTEAPTPTPPPAGGLPPPPAGGQPGTTEPGPPSPNGAAVASGAALEAALAVAVARAREAAGAKVVTRLQRAGTDRDRTLASSVGRDEVCSRLGPERLAELRLDPAALVKGSASCLTAAGHPAELAERVEAHAARTLFERVAPPLP
jgi:hypothetical protein